MDNFSSLHLFFAVLLPKNFQHYALFYKVYSVAVNKVDAKF